MVLILNTFNPKFITFFPLQYVISNLYTDLDTWITVSTTWKSDNAFFNVFIKHKSQLYKT